ncbi:hypothetical protein ACQP2U_42835 (plasmid) [Nocardia sp. CA-084685]|uniref:hypothetical protein n=1 Tax=Nocardia sp. CA-084685 TaxID=3239970 RepID=UPI003D97BFF6
MTISWDVTVGRESALFPGDRSAVSHGGAEMRRLKIRRVDLAIRRSDNYRHLCRLDSFVRPESACIFMRIGAAGAVVVPPQLGNLVRQKLGRCCPVVVGKGSDRRMRWTLLTSPGADELVSDFAIFAMLCAVDARIPSNGEEIQLPDPRDLGPRWLDGMPTSDYRPSPTAVIDAIRAFRRVR